MAQPDLDKIAEHYSGILKELGADLDSEGMKETPLRAAEALVEMTEGSLQARLRGVVWGGGISVGCPVVPGNRANRIALRSPFLAASLQRY
jgi:hypothetical protein